MPSVNEVRQSGDVDHDELVSKTKYGYFTDDGKEYVCTNPITTRPWINLISNHRYGVAFSQVGGGYSLLHPNRRINKTHGIRSDAPGKYIYIRDNDTGDFWTTNYMPVRREYEYYRYRAGCGYSIIESETQGIESSFRIFVPVDESPVDVWTVSIKNTSAKKRNLSVFPYVSWHLATATHADNDTRWFSLAKKETDSMLIGTYQDPLLIPTVYTAFLATSLPVIGYECNDDNFKGGHYGELSNPRAVREGKCTNEDAGNTQIVGCFQHNLTLAPGQRITFNLVQGYSTDPSERKALADKYLKDPDTEYKHVKTYWDNKLSKINIETPDPVFNRSVNRWLTYQVYQCTRWCRSDSARYGYRDVLQDIRGILSLEPEYALTRFLEALQYQWSDGHCLRQWSATGDHDNRPYMDSPYWIVFFLSAYLKETGDLGILEKNVKYFDKGDGTVYDHAKRAYDWLHEKRGEHGLSLLGGGDVNDSFDWAGKDMRGESMWLSEAYYWGLKELEEIACRINDEDRQLLCRKRANELSEAFNKCAWDGQWFLRAFDDRGCTIGSNSDKCCKIHLYSQTWAALSEIAPRERLIEALESADKLLEIECGVLRHWPAFDGPDPNIGKFSTLVGHPVVYVHGNTYKIAADIKMGRGDKAFATFKKILPCRRDNDPKGAKAEPWAFPNSYGNMDDPGRSEVGWFTGSASWLFFTATEWMPGIIPDYDGLRVKPCIPSAWKKLKLRRPYRNAIYNITINNPDGLQSGVKKVTVDGSEIGGTLIKPHSDGKEHTVDVIMG